MALSFRPTDAQECASPAELARLMSRLFAVPLDALQAAIEGLGDGRDHALGGALEHVVRLRRDAETLVDYLSETPPAALSCSCEEIVRTILARLDADQTRRLQWAREAGSERFVVDGPRLARSLRTLIEGVLEDGEQEILLQIHGSDEYVEFQLVGDAACFDEQALLHARSLAPANATGAARETARELRRQLALRDLQRMGAELRRVDTARGVCCCAVRLPRAAGLPIEPPPALPRGRRPVANKQPKRGEVNQ